MQVHPPYKLPLLYLLDSIIKNLGGVYVKLFQTNIVAVFRNAFAVVDKKVRESMVKLLKTWRKSPIAGTMIFEDGILLQMESLVQIHQPKPIAPVIHGIDGRLYPIRPAYQH